MVSSGLSLSILCHTDNLSGAVCIAPQAAKVLPCGHIYHLGCLRDWLQQSGTDNFTCPICRTPLFVKKQGPPGEAIASIAILYEYAACRSLRPNPRQWQLEHVSFRICQTRC